LKPETLVSDKGMAASHTRWASQEAAIKAEINEAKNTLDLMRMVEVIQLLILYQSREPEKIGTASVLATAAVLLVPAKTLFR
jgi:hypothetical protein